MNHKQFQRIQQDKGFIAALDQSGGSTPKALSLYGVEQGAYSNDQEMFALVHEMRTRIMTSPAFDAKFILGVILFEDTMDRSVEGEPTSEYLWKRKGMVPFLKVDKGLEEAANGVQLMKPIPDLQSLLQKAVHKKIFGTKMRSVIKAADARGIADLVAQQFDIAMQIYKEGLVPIIEPEADIHMPDRHEAEEILKREVCAQLSSLPSDVKVMFKFSIPVQDGFYTDLMGDPHVARIVALSGGYSREEADEKLTRNKGLIASFSRALLEGLSAQQSKKDFDATLAASVKVIYEASIT